MSVTNINKYNIMLTFTFEIIKYGDCSESLGKKTYFYFKLKGSTFFQILLICHICKENIYSWILSIILIQKSIFAIKSGYALHFESYLFFMSIFGKM